jgi:hypothetical protein
MSLLDLLEYSNNGRISQRRHKERTLSSNGTHVLCQDKKAMHSTTAKDGSGKQ